MKRIALFGNITFLVLIVALWPVSQIFIGILLFVSFMEFVVGAIMKYSLEETDERQEIGEGLFWSGLIWIGVMLFISVITMFSEMAKID